LQDCGRNPEEDRRVRLQPRSPISPSLPSLITPSPLLPSQHHRIPRAMPPVPPTPIVIMRALTRSMVSHLGHPSSILSRSRRLELSKPIPGCTDGSDGWRTEVYSLAKPRDHSLPVDESSDPKRAYKGFVASSHRQGGVHSTLDQKYHVPQPLANESKPPPCNKTVNELYSKSSPAAASLGARSNLPHLSSLFLAHSRQLLLPS
jgi:hypothetical protein